ncbi:antibiotic biosynthesis monooxygenase family protein [Pontibacter sp. CAU 1760]
MIARHWTGVFRASDATAYTRHLREELFPALSKLKGFRGATVQQRELAQGEEEFLVISHWDSLEDIRAFAGDSSLVAVVPVAIQQLAVRYDRMVRHYEVVHASHQPE